MLRNAWETLAYLYVEIRKCPKVHQLAECSGIAVAHGGEATPGSHSWHFSSHVPAVCAGSAGVWGCLLTRKVLLELIDHLQGRVISEKELTHMSAWLSRPALEASQAGPGYGGLGWLTTQRNDGCTCELSALILWGLRELC